MPTAKSSGAWRWEKVWSGENQYALSTHGFRVLHFPEPGNAIHCGGWAEVWSRPDGGKRWSASERLGRLGHTFIHDLWSRGGAVYASASIGAVFVSADRGKHWKERNLGTRQHLHGVCGEPAGKRLYVVGGGGLAAVSENEGATWKRLKTGTKADLFQVWVAPEGSLQPGRVVATGFGVCLWTDAKGRWQQAAIPPTAAQGIAHLWASDGALFAADVLGQLLTSTDLGQTWRLVGQTPCSWLLNAVGSGQQVCVHGRAGDKAGEPFGCWISSDGGKRWRRLAFKGAEALTSMAFGRDGSLWVSTVFGKGMNHSWTELLHGRPGAAAKTKAKSGSKTKSAR